MFLTTGGGEGWSLAWKKVGKLFHNGQFKAMPSQKHFCLAKQYIWDNQTTPSAIIFLNT